MSRTIVTEIERRRIKAQRLREAADAELEAAKNIFEHKLLGEEV